MEIFNFFLDTWSLMLPISVFMFLKKSIMNVLCASLLLGILLFRIHFEATHFFIVIFVIANLVPKVSEKIDEVIMRYLASGCLLIYLTSNKIQALGFELSLFFATLLIIFIVIKDYKKKLLTIALVCFPIMTTEVEGYFKFVLLLPFLLLPLLHDRLKERDFSLFCLSCIVIIGRYGTEQIVVSGIGFIVLGSFIVMQKKYLKNEVVA